MRSRYTAFAKRKFAYLAKTMQGQATKEFDLQQAQKEAPFIKWLKLEVLYTEATQNKGIVEFKAYFRFNNQNAILHEISQFECLEGVWFYVGKIQ